MAQALAVKYRPQTLEEIVSQKSIIKILTKQVQSGLIKNCYLFCGPSGTGKTTTARAFAKLINKGIGEPIEIDAASNSGVDNVREIIRQAQERSIEGKYKIFIIDECHAMSNHAWQAFLKCIEEPPTYTIFMFCTTDPQKIPATIINRVQRFNLTKIETPLIVERLKYICRCEQIEYNDDAIEFIAKLSDGGMRDSIASLEKVADYGHVNIDNTLECLGSYSYAMFFTLVNAIIDGRDDIVLQVIDDVHSQGSDLKIFVEQFLNFCLDLSKYAIFGNCSLTKLPSSMEDEMKNATAIENAKSYYVYLIDKLLDLKMMLKNDTNIKDTIEVCFLRMCRYL
jgi:DNA polymerase-3 subunit gamma/tau